jgi:hypothetical protein
MYEYDKSSKWLIQHHGDSILRMAGIVGIETWRPLQADVVQPRQLPDGLIEALLQGQFEPSLFVLELATYPESRIAEQVLRDMTLVYLDRRVVPDVITLVLHPRGEPSSHWLSRNDEPGRDDPVVRPLEGRPALVDSRGDAPGYS